MLSDCMNITQSYVSFLFFFLTRFLSARFKVFHWERKFCLFLISAVFSILEVYMDLNSVLLVFCFCFCFLFSFFLGDKHGCLISEISTWWDFFLSQKYHLNFKHSAAKTLWEPFQVRDIFLDPQRELCGCGSLFLMDSVQPGTHACSILTPDLLMLKEKKLKKNL